LGTDPLAVFPTRLVMRIPSLFPSFSLYFISSPPPPPSLAPPQCKLFYADATLTPSNHAASLDYPIHLFFPVSYKDYSRPFFLLFFFHKDFRFSEKWAFPAPPSLDFAREQESPKLFSFCDSFGRRFPCLDRKIAVSREVLIPLLPFPELITKPPSSFFSNFLRYFPPRRVFTPLDAILTQNSLSSPTTPLLSFYIRVAGIYGAPQIDGTFPPFPQSLAPPWRGLFQWR